MWATAAVLCFLLGVGASGRADRVVINKHKREMLLLSSGKVIRSYRIALGSHPVGHKSRLGDGKTPEGHYTIVGRNARSAYYRSLRISYPNE